MNNTVNMNEIFSRIKDISADLAISYNLDIGIFLVIYLLSFLPFYLGYFLMLYGTTRNLKVSDIITLKFKNKLHWNTHVKIGLYIHLFGRVMPYVYILFFGRNLPILVYPVVLIILIVSIFILHRKFSSIHNHKTQININIHKNYIVDDSVTAELLWNIYSETFDPINKASPCKQSFDKGDFLEVLRDKTVIKYLLYKTNVGYIGMCLLTSDFKNTPWISEEYFKAHFLNEYQENNIYYLLGIAIHKKERGGKYAIKILEYIIDELPEDSIIGFDHSKNVNPILHHFTRVVRQSSKIIKNHIDQQHYHVVKIKK